MNAAGQQTSFPTTVVGKRPLPLSSIAGGMESVPLDLSGSPGIGTSLIRLPAVKKRVSLGKTAIYALIAVNKFPRPVKMGVAEGGSGWLDVEIDRWIASLVAARDA